MENDWSQLTKEFLTDKDEELRARIERLENQSGRSPKE